MPLDPGRFVADILLSSSGDATGLLQYLIRIQAEYSYIPESAIAGLTEALELPAAEVRSVIDFYSFLHGTPRGRYDILFSDSITDHMLGSRELLTQLRKKLTLTNDIPRSDGRVTIDVTSCTGICEQGPALLVNGRTIGHLDAQRIEQIAHLVETANTLDDWPAELFLIEDIILRQDDLLSALSSHEAGTDTLEKLLSGQPDEVLDTLQQAGLRGRGGAGFETAVKWRSCRQAKAKQRVVVCNADEGEPGTFKDRVLLQSYASHLIEGMTLCAATIGANKGFIYLRGEYQYLFDDLQAILQHRRDAGLLGKDILGQPDLDFDIEIHLGAGAYICGEESALLESLEGKRGIPRVRPPFPVDSGYLGQPTVVNNVETFIAAAMIILKGADWFRATGTKASAGTKLLSISGDCEHPGVYEYPFGTSIKDILLDCGAQHTQAVQIGGPAGHMIAPADFHRCIAFEDLSTGGSFMIFNKQRDLLDVVENFTAFFVHENCGFCTPCRVGTSLIKKQLDKLQRGQATCDDVQTMQTIGSLMCNTSHCGLGATAANPVLDLFNNFFKVYAHRLRSTSFEPGFDLDAALEEARQLTQRDDVGAHIKDRNP